MSTSYQPFRDSSDVKTDGPALQARMKEDGYLFIKGLYPKEMIANLRRQTLAIAAEAGWLKKGTAIEESIAEPSSACADPEPRYLAPFKKMYRLEDFHAAAHHPNAIGLMERLTAPRWRRMRAPSSATCSRNGRTSPRRRIRISRIFRAPPIPSVWAPLGDCPVERGGLMMAEGSHKEGVPPLPPLDGCGRHGGPKSL